jgi:hypothetical protein
MCCGMRCDADIRATFGIELRLLWQRITEAVHGVQERNEECLMQS